MDTIETFLDNMFAPYPATPRLIEARSELRAMMEDAYNDAIAQGKTHNEAVGQVITDFGNLHELAPVLGIAQDIQPGGAPQVAPPVLRWPPSPAIRLAPRPSASRPPGAAIRTTTPSPTSWLGSTGRPQWSSTCCGASSSTPGTSPGSSGRWRPSPSPSSPPCATTGAIASESLRPGAELTRS